MSEQCGEETDVYSRVTGFFQSKRGWHKGKLEEDAERVTYEVQDE